MLLTVSAARRSASSPLMARLRLAARSLRNALTWAAASGAVSIDRTRALASGGRAASRTSSTSYRWASTSPGLASPSWMALLKRAAFDP
jgi:hypothetical protein